MYRPSGRRAADIAADVEAAIAAGRAPAGTVLPPVRGLAEDLGVSPGTVAAAYRLLAERGAVEGHARGGTVIRSRPAAPIRRSPVVPAGTRDLASGNPDPGLLPDLAGVLADIAEIRVEAGIESAMYGDPSVMPEMDAWARSSFAADGIDVAAVTVTGGARAGGERALAVRLRPGMRVAVEDPGYAGLLDLLLAMGLTAEPVAVDDEGMVPASLAAAVANGVQAVVVTPRAQNPTGAALSAARAAELTQVLARTTELLLIEDDHAGPISGAGPHSLMEPQRPGIVVRSASKAMGPDLRIAVVGGDAETVGAIEARQAVGAGWVSHILQQIVLAIVTSPSVDVAIEVAAREYAVRRTALVDALAALGVIAHARSGFNVWVPVPEEASVVAGMAARGWAVAGGARYRIASPPAVRVTTAGLPADEAADVAADLAGCIASVGTTRAG
ncbi:MAG: aminotransferase class I/II-fold pyridoxal phosphate-dependent enzyme [Acidimicrobiales bacterium]